MTNKMYSLKMSSLKISVRLFFLIFPSAYNRTEEKCSRRDFHCWNPVWSVADSCA